MGDASGNHNKQSNMDQYVQRGGKRTHTQLEQTRDDVTPTITPTPSMLGDSSGMETDPDLSEGENSGNINNINNNNRIVPPSIIINGSAETVVGADRMENEKLKLAFKLDRLKNKCGRYESHVTFLRKCLENNVIPNGLKAYVEPSIGNRDDAFLGDWHGTLFECSKKLTTLSIDWSLKTIASTKVEIATTEETLKALVSEQSYKKIQDSIQKNDETRNKELVNRKNRKFYRLKYGERDRDDQPQPAATNNRQNEILNNRGQRGQGRPRQDENMRNDRYNHGNEDRSWNDRAERNSRNVREDRQPEQHGRYANNHYNDNNNHNNRGDRAVEERVLEAIDRRTRNYVAATNGVRGPRANDRDLDIHEKISLGRRNSRRNMRIRNDSPGEDFPPLERERPRDDRTNQRNHMSPREGNDRNERPREDHPNQQNRPNPREGNDNNRAKDNEIEALRRRIASLQRERTNGEQVSSHYIPDDDSKNDNRAQVGPTNPLSNMDMQAYIKTAMETICGFAEQLSLQNGSERTHTDM